MGTLMRLCKDCDSRGAGRCHAEQHGAPARVALHRRHRWWKPAAKSAQHGIGESWPRKHIARSREHRQSTLQQKEQGRARGRSRRSVRFAADLVKAAPGTRGAHMPYARES